MFFRTFALGACGIVLLSCAPPRGTTGCAIPMETTARFPSEPRAEWAKLPTRFSRPCGESVVMMLAEGKGRVERRFGGGFDDLLPGDAVWGPVFADAAIEGEGILAVLRLPSPQDSCVPTDSPPQVWMKRAEHVNATWASGKMQAHLDHRGGLGTFPNLYLGRLQAEGPVREHVHAGSWEVILVVSGSGTMTLGDETRPISARDIALVPPYVRHSFVPRGPVRVVQGYFPSGPEGRFLDLARREREK